MAEEETKSAVEKVKYYTSGAVGAGLVLIVLPCIALYCGVNRMGETPTVGLPILAIFGILILFGALAIISTLFARLSLSDPSQALALPEGSIRAAIALALIVLFAIISIMLYQSISKPYVIADLSEPEKAEMLKDLTNRVIAVVPTCQRTEGAPDCKYAVHVLQPQGQESTDLAKQLLILIGTLMTSVTSFYFASRATEPKRQGESSETAGDDNALGDAKAGGLSSGREDDGDIDGCDVAVVDATSDEDLPASRGGVA